MPRIFPLALAALILASCGDVTAPDERGVCWRSAAAAGDGAAKFTPLAQDVSSLENCAVLLEAVRLQTGSGANGAYQGYFIFVDAAEMSSASHAGGLHYPIFQPPQREAVDRDLRRLIRERGGRLPGAGEITLERH
ncbi:MAG: hypothetical protein JO127_06575 [Caulobacteraceae bacterium]|nr:hypothetical protein [Caulobacteraceae bacterium]